MSREWKVLKDGKLYTDRFNNEDEAYEYIWECEDGGIEGFFTIEEMTKDEIDKYYD